MCSGSAAMRLRMIKSSEEIEHIGRMAAIADKGGEACREAISPGVAEFEVASGLELTTRAARQNDRNVLGAVLVAVPDPRAKQHHRVVEQAAAVLFADVTHPGEHVGKLLAIEAVDASNLLEVLFFALMMREVVVAVADTDLGEAAIAAVVGEDVRGEAGDVPLKREHKEIADIL